MEFNAKIEKGRLSCWWWKSRDGCWVMVEFVCPSGWYGVVMDEASKKFGRREEGSGAGLKWKSQKKLCVPYVPCAEILRGARRQGR